MRFVSTEAPANACAGRTDATGQHILFVLIALASFGLYWLSSFLLEARNDSMLFGADTPLYTALGEGNAVDRVTRFHPLTTALIVVWMKIVSPLTIWLAWPHLLRALFAAIGAAGVWAALWTFAAVIPRRYVALLGIIYATSLGVWYLSSIEESKILTTTLTALYIGVYLRLRETWTLRGALLLTVILLAACLNEIVAGFLVIIPAVDTLVQRGWNLRHSLWIAWHALAAPAALVFLEGVVNGKLVPPGALPEGKSHLSMLLYYVLDNKFGMAEAHAFLANWVFFSIAAPTPEAVYAVPPWPHNKAYFEPVLANYLSSPISAGLVALLGVMAVTSVLPRYRAKGLGHLTGILLALLAYATFRGTFFFILNPFEGLLYSGPTTLAHMLLLGIPFAASEIPAKQWLLAAFATLLFMINGAFIIGACALLLKGCP